MTRQLKYRGRKPAHARDPLAFRPAEVRAACEPKIAIRLPRSLIVDIGWRWKRYVFRRDGFEAKYLPAVRAAMPYLARLLQEYPIAGEIDVNATWFGWLSLVEFALRVKGTELATRVIPVLSQSKYDTEAVEQPTVDDNAIEMAAASFPTTNDG